MAISKSFASLNEQFFMFCPRCCSPHSGYSNTREKLTNLIYEIVLREHVCVGLYLSLATWDGCVWHWFLLLSAIDKLRQTKWEAKLSAKLMEDSGHTSGRFRMAIPLQESTDNQISGKLASPTTDRQKYLHYRRKQKCKQSFFGMWKIANGDERNEERKKKCIEWK